MDALPHKKINFRSAVYSSDINLEAVNTLKGIFGYSSLAEFRTLADAFYTVNTLSGQVNISKDEWHTLGAAQEFLGKAYQGLAAEMATYQHARNATDLPFHYLCGALEITQYGGITNKYMDWLGIDIPTRPLVDAVYGYSEKATQIGLMLKTAGMNADTNHDGKYSIAESLVMLEKHREDMRKKNDGQGVNTLSV